MGNELKRRGELEEGKLAVVIVPEPERSNPFVPFPSSHCPVVWVGVLENNHIYSQPSGPLKKSQYGNDCAS